MHGPNAAGSSGLSRVDIFRKLRSKIEDDFEIKLMRAEGVHAHGFFAAACDLAVELANKMIQNPPNLLPSQETALVASIKVQKCHSYSRVMEPLYVTTKTIFSCVFQLHVLMLNAICFNHLGMLFPILCSSKVTLNDALNYDYL